MKTFKLMITIAAVFLTSCGGLSEKKRMERTEKLLEAKYGEDFETAEYYRDNGTYYSLSARPANNREVVFVVHQDKKDDLFSDTYAEHLVHYKVAKMAAVNMGGGMTNMYIRSQTIGFVPPVDDPNITLEEYSKLTSNYKFGIDLFVTEDEVTKPDFYDRLSRIKTGIGNVQGSVEVIVVTKEKLNYVRNYFLKYDKGYFDLTKELGLGTLPGIYAPFDGETMELDRSEFQKFIESLPTASSASE